MIRTEPRPSHPLYATAAAVLTLAVLGARSRGDEPPAAPAAPPSAARPAPGVDLLRGPWDGGPVRRESVLFVRDAGGRTAAKLLYDAARVEAVVSAGGQATYEAGRDYRVAADGSGLELPTGSRVPFIDESDLFRPKGSPLSLPSRAGHPETNVLFDNKSYFHDHQVEVSYTPRRADWDAPRPAFAGDKLRGTLARLRAKRPLTIAVSGDSISEGYNASAFTHTAPFQPAYPALVAAQLGRTYGVPVTLRNKAVAGWSSAQGLKELPGVLACQPDLVIVAYGMNDVGARNPEAFRANIAAILEGIHAARPAAEVILVAPMTGNPDWVHTPADMFPKYRDALASLEGPGVALADLTTVWTRVLRRKRPTDLTGNGVNHPNDHGHRLYAQAILALLVESRPPTTRP